MAFKNFIREFLFSISDRLATIKKTKTIPNTLLLVRVDAIGDYILFRNFIEVIRKSKKYRNHKIILCGNIVWKDLAINLDAAFVDEFIWLDKRKMVRSISFRWKILRKISRLGVEIAMQPTYSRDFYSGDAVIRASKAKERIGSVADMTILTESQKLVSDKYYTSLINVSATSHFEFDRNKEIISQIIQEQIDLLRPKIFVREAKAFDFFDIKQPYVAICPSASKKCKRWSVEKFANVADFLSRTYKLSIVIVGSKEDSYLASEMIQFMKNKDCVNDTTGRASLTELTGILSVAKLVISNDTAAVHIAAAVRTAVVCISKGDHFGRFTEYPEEAEPFFVTIYPEEIQKNRDNEEYLLQNFRFESKLDINRINEDVVKESVRQFLE